MKFKIEIDCSNDAFHGHPEREIVRILGELAARIEIGDAAGKVVLTLHDVNGNLVGTAKFVS